MYVLCSVHMVLIHWERIEWHREHLGAGIADIPGYACGVEARAEEMKASTEIKCDLQAL